MSTRGHIPRDVIDRNPPARAYTRGLPWVSRAAWVAFAAVPGKPGVLSAAAVKAVLWDLVYADESTTSTPMIAGRCGLGVVQATKALLILQEHGLVTRTRARDGTSYRVNYEAVAKLDRCRAATQG